MAAKMAADGRAYLATHGDMAKIHAEFRDSLLSLCSWKRFEAGASIAAAGDAASQIFALVEGHVALTTALGPSDARMTHIFHPGNWFGFVPLFTGSLRNGSLDARSDCLLACLGHGQIERLLADNPAWWRHIGHLSIISSNTMNNIIADLMIADSRRRCLATLLRIANCRFETRSEAPVEAHVTQDELGAIANLSRNSVSRILRDVNSDGLVEIGYHRITLLRPDLIRQLADDV